MLRGIRNIVLRKFAGRLEACWQSAGGICAAPAKLTPLSSIAFALCAILVLPLLLLGVIAAFAVPSPEIASVNPMFVGLALAGTLESNALVEKRQAFAAKQKEIADVFEAAGADLDFSRKSVLEKLGANDSSDAVAKVKSRNIELEALSAELQKAELLQVKGAIGERENARNMPVSMERGLHPVADFKARSLGDLVIESKDYKSVDFGKVQGVTVSVDIGLKTLMETTAGFAPEAIRTGLLVEAATRPIQILDLIPTRPINQNSDKYMEETTRTHSAAEKAEGVAYAESVFVWTEKTQAVEKITDSLPVTDEQLEDAPQVAGLINSRLTFGLRQRLDLQVLVGDGTAPNLKGVLDHSIQSQAKGADPVFDAVFKALTLVRFTGRAFPNAMVFHPNDWQDVRLTRTADGQYIMGPPSAPGATTLFGIQVAISDALTENTGLVGDFANFCYIGERRGVNVQVGYVGDQFKEGKRTIRADLRAVFTVTRPNAFCKITGI